MNEGAYTSRLTDETAPISCRFVCAASTRKTIRKKITTAPLFKSHTRRTIPFKNFNPCTNNSFVLEGQLPTSILQEHPTLNQIVNASEIASVMQSVCGRYRRRAHDRDYDDHHVRCLLHRDFFGLPQLRALLSRLEICFHLPLLGSCCESGFDHDSDHGFARDCRCDCET